MKQSEFDEHVSELATAAQGYYQEVNASALSDSEYDLKLEFLQNKVGEQPELITPQYRALVENVAAGTVSKNKKLVKVKHSSPMMSIDKAKKDDVKKIEQFFKNTSEFGADKQGWECQLKLDGNAVAAIYENGMLKQLITRGNGEEGDAIVVIAYSDKAEIVGLPTAVNIKEPFELRGELLMTVDQFEKTDAEYYRVQKLQNDENIKTNEYRKNNVMSNGREFTQKLIVKSEEELHLANQRNAIGGVMSSVKENGEFSIEYKAYMTFYVHGVPTLSGLPRTPNGNARNDGKQQKADTSTDNVKDGWLADNGFIGISDLDYKTFGDNNKVFNIQELNEIIAKYERLAQLNEDAVRNIYGVPTDGIVVKCVENERISKEMGSTAHHPKSMLAIKMQGSEAIGVIKDIEVGVGRTGRLTLTAVLEEAVKIDGSQVQKASLHNFDWLTKKNVRIGSTVAVVKRNDIIPYIEAVLSQRTDSKKVPLPRKCPLCKNELDKRTLLWRCPNEQCPSRLLPALEQAVSRNYLNIDDLSVETLEALADSGLVKDLVDIFTLTFEDLKKLPLPRRYTVSGISADGVSYQIGDQMLLGSITAEKIITAIGRAKTLGLSKMLASLNIPTLGLQLAKNLARTYPDIQAIQAASEDELKEVELISIVKAEIIHRSLQEKAQMIERLIAAGVDMTSHEYVAGGAKEQTLPLAGQTIVISGNIPGYNREQAKELVESLGAKTAGTVSAKTTLVIADPNSTTSKVTKAKELGVKVQEAEEFLISLTASESGV